MTQPKTNLAYLKRIMHVPDFVKGEYNTLFIEKNARMLVRSNGSNEEIENVAMIAAYMDYLVNLEENASTQLPDGRPISRWREFGLQKGVLSYYLRIIVPLLFDTLLFCSYWGML